MSKLKTITVGFTFTARPLALPERLLGSRPVSSLDSFEQQLRAVAESANLTPEAIENYKRAAEKAAGEQG